jgi:hypothetical protein
MICVVCNSEFKPEHHLSVTCSSECKEANKKLTKRAYYDRNKEEVISRSKATRLANPEKQKESYNSNKHKYRDRQREYRKEYKKKNKDRIREYSKEYELRPERRIKMADYRVNPINKARSRESGVRYRDRNPKVSKNGHLRRKYGITIEVYEQMLKSQGGVCKICKNPETEVDKKRGKLKDLAVDHCHTTGKVRGLLCGRCNKALGKFNDDPVLLRSAVSYLEENIDEN